jgi:hypothetical protein
VTRVKDKFEYEGKMLRLVERRQMQRLPQFKENTFFGYYINTLERSATVKDNQTKQISLVTAVDVSDKMAFLYSGTNYYYTSRHGKTASNQKVCVFVEIQNRRENTRM